jgi:hypothetical protein
VNSGFTQQHPFFATEVFHSFLALQATFTALVYAGDASGLEILYYLGFVKAGFI